MAQPTVVVQPAAPQPAPVVVAPPPPSPQVTVQTAPATVVAVPDTYVWDGTEYVGVVGTDYFYLGSNNVWVPLDSSRMTRWHDWERTHTDWRQHATRNVQYRRDAQGHDHPWSNDKHQGNWNH